MMTNSLSTHTSAPDTNIRRDPDIAHEMAFADGGLVKRTWLGLALVVFLVFGIGGWAAIAKISGAVIASGTIVVDNNIKKVQHPTGGVVGEIRVKNGDRVQPDQLLIRLDDTQTRAALGIITSQLIELHGRKARLAAERDDAPVIVFPAGFEKQGAEAVRVANGERSLLESRRRSLAGQKGQLRERIKQLDLEAQGLTSQHRAKSLELEIVREELARVLDMQKRSLIPITRLLAIRRDETRSDGEYGSLVSQIGRVGGQAAEIELQILNLDQSMRTDAQKELREVEGRIAELDERRIASDDQLKRIDIRAPQAGVVHELAVNTIGGVIGAAETLMLIVPIDEVLTVEVRIAPQDIDQVRLGQKVMMRFVAFNQRTTPELPGTIARLAADLSREAQSGSMFYVARIGIDQASIARLGKLKLVPGMPVEAYIATGDRTALSYLVKPFTDHVNRMFRED